MGLFPRAARQYLDALGIPSGPNSQIYIVDPLTGGDGDDDNPGTSFERPLATVAAAYAKCTTNQNDAVVMVGGPTADTQSAILTWAKDYTHLVGMSAPIPGIGQRCRLNAVAAGDLVNVMTLSGDGCIVKNIQFMNESDADVDSGAVIVTGHRNYFENCFIAGMGHATPAARAGSWSLKVASSECVFKDCAIGLDTIVRAAANAELWLASPASKALFIHCRFTSASETAGKFMVSQDAGAAGWFEFDDCVFHNQSVNWAATLANAFEIGGTATYDIILRGLNQLVGIDGWADTVTHLHLTAPAPDAGAGVDTAPTT